MKKLFVLTTAFFVFASCENGTKENELEILDDQEIVEEIEDNMVGDDMDENGCIPSAGETWSELRNECVRIFEKGQRLNPINADDESAIISAFALFNDDESKVELFLPSTQTVLEISEDSIYENDTFKFDSNDSVLYIAGEAKYRID